ncbi:MAG: PorT family protein [Clostridiales bacterium]|jgi:hypothetical protein|nr:PorT family protein [Clostridiales bacterium]
MKKVIISTVISVLTVCGLFAQDVKFGIKGGMNLPNIMSGGTSTPVSEGYKSRMAAGWGIFTELQVTPPFSLRLGVEYSGMGGKKDGMQAMPTQRLLSEMASGMAGMMGMTPEQEMAFGMLASTTPQYYYANLKNTVKFDYVMIPVWAQYGWDVGQSPWRVYVNAGPFVSFILSGKQVSKGTGRLFSDASGATTLWDNVPEQAKEVIASQFPAIAGTLGGDVRFGTTNVTGELRGANFGVSGNVGLRYQHNRNYFFIEAGGNYGFIAVQQNDANGNNRIGAASIMLGYAFSMF